MLLELLKTDIAKSREGVRKWNIYCTDLYCTAKRGKDLRGSNDSVGTPLIDPNHVIYLQLKLTFMLANCRRKVELAFVMKNTLDTSIKLKFFY